MESDQTVTPQIRDKQFEDWLGALFRLYNLAPTLNVINEGEQIDFTFWINSLFVVGEARWPKEPVDTKQIRDFFGELLERPAFVVGLIIAMGGFTEPGVNYVRKRSGERTVLWLTRENLQDQILRAEPELPEWLDTTLRERLEHP